MAIGKKRGQVLVEFAVGLPLLLSLLFFLVECGYFMSAKQGLHIALREGAVLAATRSKGGELGAKDRAILVDVMRCALKRPGIEDITASVNLEQEGDLALIELTVEGSYSGITPLAQTLVGDVLKARLVLPLHLESRGRRGSAP